MESRLLEILVCPLCKGPLKHDRAQQELICQPDRLAFPIRDGIPVMLPDEARKIGPANPDPAPAGDGGASGDANPS